MWNGTSFPWRWRSLLRSTWNILQCAAITQLLFLTRSWSGYTLLLICFQVSCFYNKPFIQCVDTGYMLHKALTCIFQSVFIFLIEEKFLSLITKQFCSSTEEGKKKIFVQGRDGFTVKAPLLPQQCKTVHFFQKKITWSLLDWQVPKTHIPATTGKTLLYRL